MQYGFMPFVVGDACGDRHTYPHYANLFDIQAKLGEVASKREGSLFFSAKKETPGNWKRSFPDSARERSRVAPF